VMHGMKDGTAFGGLSTVMKITWVTFGASWLAIIGVPPFYGSGQGQDHQGRVRGTAGNPGSSGRRAGRRDASSTPGCSSRPSTGIGAGPTTYPTSRPDRAPAHDPGSRLGVLGSCSAHGAQDWLGRSWSRRATVLHRRPCRSLLTVTLCSSVAVAPALPGESVPIVPGRSVSLGPLADLPGRVQRALHAPRSV
jgi:hypothetical protein